MPIYEFKCKKCGHIFDEFVFSSASTSENIVCPACGEKNVDKLMSAFSASGNSTVASGPSSCGSSGFG